MLKAKAIEERPIEGAEAWHRIEEEAGVLDGEPEPSVNSLAYAAVALMVAVILALLVVLQRSSV